MLNPADIEVQKAGSPIVELAARVLAEYGLEGDTILHAVRGLRSIFHGFASLEQQKGFGMDLDVDKSIHLVITAFIEGLQKII